MRIHQISSRVSLHTQLTAAINKSFFCFQSETLSSEKEDLLAGMETMRSTLKQLETKNQEMQRQSANLERDLLAERSIKEQKIKVEMKRDGCHLPLLCKQLLYVLCF